MTTETGKSVSPPLGVVVRKAPGVTGWTEWSWKAVAVLPGAAQVSWSEMRRDGKAVEHNPQTKTRRCRKIERAPIQEQLRSAASALNNHFVPPRTTVAAMSPVKGRICVFA